MSGVKNLAAAENNGMEVITDEQLREEGLSGNDSESTETNSSEN